MKTARNTTQEQANYTSKSAQLSQCFRCGGKRRQPRQQHCPKMEKNVENEYHWPFRGRLQGWNTTTKLGSSYQILSLKKKKGSLRFGVRCNPTICKEIFWESALNTRRDKKVVEEQIDSSSTCNTIPSSLLRELFPDAQILWTRSKINTYGSKTMHPEVQVTLSSKKTGRIHTIDFLVVIVQMGNQALN